MNELQPDFVSFEKGSRFDKITYIVDDDTIAILHIPKTGPSTFEIKKGRMYVPGSSRHSYRNTWLTFNVPPQYRYLATTLSHYHQLHFEVHPNPECYQEGAICYVCLSRKMMSDSQTNGAGLTSSV